MLKVYERRIYMVLPYNSEYEKYANNYLNYNNGVFIDGRDSKIQIINPELTSHDADPIFETFEKWFNPKDIYAPYNKEEAIKCLKGNIEYLSQMKDLSFELFLKLKLFQYFLLVYSSDYTKMRENGKDVIELFETTGYHPLTYYVEDESHSWRLPERLMFREDLLNIFKSILVQSCDIDSLEIAFSQYQRSLSKTILTSKFNPYETFYNYILMDWNVQVIPKKLYNLQTQIFEEYEQNAFFVPDSELRLKDEIQAIKKLVPLNERPKYYR